MSDLTLHAHALADDADLLRAQRDRAVAEAGWAEIVAADARRDQASLFDDWNDARRDAWLLAMEVVRVLDMTGPERAEAEQALRQEARGVMRRHRHGGDR